MRCFTLVLGTCSLLAACGGDGGPIDPPELITTVTLTFTPTGGGTAVTAAFDDPDGPGGAAPVIDPINLPAASYMLGVRFENGLETPPEDITIEVADEADQHQLFFIGTAVNGPASDRAGAPLTHAYADRDANDLPVGLQNTITATAGTGQLVVTLRHLPPVNGNPVKTAELAGTVKTSGLAAIGGESDAMVSFDVTVP
ncbi:MAG: hypothetical protein H0T89_30070 [Deltaproteobacteria bacterium]|nr:hypothetical protein [Deltaproteobacteria bacterium]MDQ3300498.1 hypothetical protein [Myxococcota bacterium]